MTRLLTGFAGGLAMVVLVAAAAVAGLVAPGTLTYVDVPVIIVPLANRSTVQPRGTAAKPAKVAMLSAAEPDRGNGPPLSIDAALQETTGRGSVPRIAADGRTSLLHYARPGPADCARPCISVVITGLGLADKLSNRALALPGAVGLAFSPYVETAVWQARARAAGHEALLALPLQPARYPDDDTGPFTILASLSPEQQLDALLRVLATGSGYVAVTGEAGAFAASPEAFAPVARALVTRGLGLVEIGGDALAGQCRAVDLPTAAATAVIDTDPTPAAIDRALTAVAAEARRSGRALAVAQPLPASFERLTAWLASLPEQGFELVPPSRFLQVAPSPALARQ